MPQKKHLAILGSTGSIGHQTLEVVRMHEDLFRVDVLTARSQWQLLVEQAKEFRPKAVVIRDTACYPQVLKALEGEGIDVYAGEEATYTLVQDEDISMVIVAIVGYAGLIPTVRALEAGKTVGLANKEALVVAGELVMGLSAKYNAPILPLDSEHSAIFQCLVGELSQPERLILTASGGPFREKSLEELERVTPIEALAHPAWNMGAKISVDSATMMNKGLEVIEAHWLFNMPYDDIEVLVHPQAIIHSMVQFSDGALKAQLGTPDMRIPIQYALTYPYRIPSPAKRYVFGPGEDFTFEQPDLDRFPCLSLAMEAGRMGGNAPCALNAANEVAVSAFLNGQLSFQGIRTVVERSLETLPFIEEPSLDDYVGTDTSVREQAMWLVEKLDS
ncbi:MAG: 1-deoxy-D-xylulose-5-phosphate reductoisomerase [Bacteroidetes bacterium]|nr:MAG: 1-deoxy-D-xylulose-5-phosphate reductoisomerase [Bacteroidota bacterium]